MGKLQDESNILWCQKERKCSKKGKGKTKGERSQLEGAPIGQFWDIVTKPK